MTTLPVRPLPFLRRSTAALAALLAIGTGAAGLAAAEESPDELREERRQVQAEAAEVAQDVDALTDDVDELTGALADLRASVDAEQAALDAAQRRVVDAEAAEAAARQAIADLRAEMAATQALLRDASVRAFVGFQGPSDEIVFSDNPWEHARTEALVAFGTGNTADLIDELRSLGSELEDREREAEATTTRLEEERAAVERRKAALDDAVTREEAVLAEVDARLDARLAEAAALQALDADLAGRIEAEERRIAEAIRERERRAAQNRAASGGASGGGGVTIPAGAPVNLATVRGIVVNASIAGQVDGLLGAMEARGFPLGGGGYRGSERQVELRRAHCGSSDYAIWEMPSSQCRPPTAPPGSSQHELGLAIDFTYQGAIISSRGSAVFQALAEVAPQYGFYNLPSEPWHWSTTGG